MLRHGLARLSQLFRRRPRYHGLNELDRKLERYENALAVLTSR